MTVARGFSLAKEATLKGRATSVAQSDLRMTPKVIECNSLQRGGES